MYGPLKNFVFDLDGTLIDSMPLAIRGFRHVVKEVAGEELSDDDLYRVLGQSPQAMIVSFVGESKLEEGIACWNDFTSQAKKEDIPAFEGVQELLESIAQNKDCHVGVFTGRDRKGARHFLETHGWLGNLIPEENLRCGDDGFAHKPSGEAIQDLLAKKEWSSRETLYVGDSPLDAKAGRHASCVTAAALWDNFFSEGKSERAKYQSKWLAWNEEDVDLRLPEPKALRTWVGLS